MRGLRTTLLTVSLAGFCLAGLADMVSLRTATTPQYAAITPPRQRVKSSVSTLDGVSQPLREHGVNALLGMRVENGDSQLLGTIKDFVVERRSGEVSFALISSGGFLGVHSRLRAVPLQNLSPATAKRRTLELDVGLARWRRTPTVNIRHLSALASEVIGQSVLNKQGQKVARISDLLIDVGGQKPAMAVLSLRPGLKSLPQELLTVPLRVLTPAARDQVILNTEHSTLITKG